MSEGAKPSPSEGADLPHPIVPSSVYDDEYYLHGCAGADDWRESDGARVSGLYPGALEKAGLAQGEVVVDIGTGRGDLLAAALERGAARAIGVEYSEAAVEMARRTIAVHGVEERADILHADARSIPIESEEADLVTMLDVVEHLAPAELAKTLEEAHRLLRPGGRIFIHTMPNRTIYDVTYRLQRAIRPSRRRDWPADPRLDFEHLMHVNEQTKGSLRRALRAAGFKGSRVSPGSWLLTDFVPDERAKRLYGRLAGIPLLKRFGAADLWGEGVKRSP
jgi:ubiquinone/menaquinone biosynthesis C-methylase UbiE